ncbi:MAG: DNA-processing protein DprA [Marinobacterium sp.]|nr:DNA-processing protein DprA [Marinobacterium sp.]
MTDAYRNWVAVTALPRVNAATLCLLWQQGWTPQRLLAAAGSTLQSLGLGQKAREAIQGWQLGQGPLQQRADQVSAWLQRDPHLHHVLCWDSDDYPLLLRQIPDPPPFLLVCGNPAALNMPQVGIVGSRHASRQGLRHAATFAAELADNGFVVTSGMALGIDGAAHQAVVNTGQSTIAVLGTGPDVTYPARHRQLAQQILDNNGALVSEFWPGTPPRGGHFPRRNRIISGLCSGVLVVEAAPRSGSLITARLALEYDREVFALPGALDSPLSQGCNQLIRNGATLVQTTAHIVEQLGSMLGALQMESVPQNSDIGVEFQPPECVLSEAEERLLTLMETELLSLDYLCSLSGLAVPQLLQLLMGLELKGLVASMGGSWQRIV